MSSYATSPREFRKTAIARSVSAAVVASVAAPAAAQEIEEVIVTATKREESIQDVPLAITAFTGDFVRQVNLDDVKDLVTFAPGVSGNSTDAFIDGISIRGVRTQDFGVGGDPSAAFFKNNLYEGRNGAVVTSLYDLERAEVLRGPQGFLFGRNAVGGAFSVHTKRPNLDGSTDGYVEVNAGERGRFDVEGAFTAAVTDDFAVRLALYHSQEDGHVRNVFNNQDFLGHEKTAGRLSGLWAGDNWEVFATAEYEDFDRDGSQYRAVTTSPRLADWEAALGPVNMPSDPRDINSDQFFGSEDDGNQLNLGLHVEYDFDNMALSWSTGYKDHDYLYIEDYDGTPRNVGVYAQDQAGDYFQTELRLTSTDDGPLSWYAGVSLYEESIDVKFTSILEEEAVCAYYGYYYGVDNCSDYFDYWDYYYPDVTIGPFMPSSNGQMTEETFINGKFNGWAAYVDLTYALNDQWDVSLGLRHTYDKKRFSTRTPPPESMLQSYFIPGYMTTGLTDSNDWSQTTPRLIVRYMPNDATTLFASYTEGYKSGGFGTFSLVDSAGDPVFLWFGDGPDDPLTPADGVLPDQFRPEEVESYEIGYKGLLADGTLSVDVTAFIYDYTDLQVNFFDNGEKVGNAGQVDGTGIEGSMQWAINDYLDLNITAGWLDTEGVGLQDVCDGAPDSDGILDGDEDACEGAPLHWAPEVQGSFVLNGDFPMGNGSVITSIEMFWEGERGGGFEQIPESVVDSFQEWTLRVGYASDNNWTLTGYVENITDEETYAGAQTNLDITPTWLVGPNKPRTAGMRFSYYFD
ncbi:MAG: TonB-dependent receptor [Woeseiaceae bacterium]|nr:TonB-dependent receptor [Woeseiaceae bacterium]